MRDAEHLRPAALELLTEAEAECAEADADLHDAALAPRDDRFESTQRRLFEAVAGGRRYVGRTGRVRSRSRSPETRSGSTYLNPRDRWRRYRGLASHT
jgi:hypothetical protein